MDTREEKYEIMDTGEYQYETDYWMNLENTLRVAYEDMTKSQLVDILVEEALKNINKETK
tara:strand:- start:8753 stop:8932 length:180 start_codon:yes stop_codon:yes gene_type:complete